MNTGNVQQDPAIYKKQLFRQAFWLSDQPLTSPSHSIKEQWHIEVFVPEYSNGWFVMDSHHLSF